MKKRMEIINKLRSSSRKELYEQLKKLRLEQFEMRMQKSVGQFESPSSVSVTRKSIARIKTILRQMAIDDAKSEVKEV